MVFYSRALLLGRLLSLAATAFLAASALAGSSLSSGEAPSQPDTSEESRFLSENDAAMNKMMAGMQIKPSRDVDRDFVDIMVPHHQGAIDMAQAVLRYGRNEQIRRLAQEIIVTQQQEIAAMRFAIGDPLPASMASPTQTQPVEGAEQMGGALSTSQRSMFRHHMQTRD